MSSSSVHVHLVFTLKMMWHTVSISQMQTCNHALGTYLYSHLGVASSLGQLWMCSTFLHTTHICECESPGGLAHPLDPLWSLICSNVRRSAEPLVSCASWTPSLSYLYIQHAWGPSKSHPNVSFDTTLLSHFFVTLITYARGYL